MKAPVFAYSTLDALNVAIAKGKIQYPTYCWLTDTAQYAFVNKKNEVEIAGLPKLTGTLDKEIILSNLKDGVYEVKGQHKIAESAETVYLSASYIIAIVASDGDLKKVRRITVDDVEDFIVDSEGSSEKTSSYVTTDYLAEHGYITETQIDDKIAALKTAMETEMKDYVDGIINEQIEALLPAALERELPNFIQSVKEEDVYNLFVNPSI